MIPGKQYTPLDLAHAVWRRKWLVLVSFSACTAATVAVAGRLPNRFQAAALIATVHQGVSQDYVRATVTSKTQVADRLPTISQQILSRTRLEPIVLDLDLYAEMRRTKPMEVVVDAMRADIDIDIVGASESLRVSYEATMPDTAVQVANRLAAVAIEEYVRDRLALAHETRSFLESELEDARGRLVEREKRLETYRLKYGPELPTQLQSNMQAIASTQMQMQSVSDALNRDKDRRLLAARQLADLESEEHPVDAAPGTRTSGAATGTAAELETAHAELRSMEARLTPEHPDRVRATRQVANLEARQRSEAKPAAPAADTRPLPAVSSARRSRVKELQDEIDGLDRQIDKRLAEERDLRKSYDMYRARVEAVPTRESDLISLTRDYDTLQRQYQSMLAKQEDAKVAEKLERRQIGEQFKIVDPPRRPERPVRPNRRVIDAAGAVGGLALGIALALLLEFWDRSLKTEAEVRAALSLPVLAFVPMLATAADRRRARWRKAALALSVATVFVASATVVWLTFRV